MNLLTRPPVASVEKALASVRVSLASVGQILANVRDTLASVTLGIPQFVGYSGWEFESSLALGNSHC